MFQIPDTYQLINSSQSVRIPVTSSLSSVTLKSKWKGGIMLDNNKLSSEMLISTGGPTNAWSEGLMGGTMSATQFSTHDGGPRQRVWCHPRRSDTAFRGIKSKASKKILPAVLRGTVPIKQVCRIRAFRIQLDKIMLLCIKTPAIAASKSNIDN